MKIIYGIPRIRIRKDNGKYFVEYYESRFLRKGHWLPFILFDGTGEAYPFNTLEAAKKSAGFKFHTLISYKP